MRHLWTWLAAALAAALTAGSMPTARAAALPSPAVAPLPGAIVRPFDAPQPDWRPGHRGVDVAGLPGDPVRAAAAGTVTVASVIAGVPTVVVQHGSVRTTYGPVQPSVTVGQHVSAGEEIGSLDAGHPGCSAAACLHWGLKEGDRYLNPLSLLAPIKVRLVASAPPISSERQTPTEDVSGGASGGPLRRPPGPITSSFGMRMHPVIHEYVLHDGTDFGLGCGVPVGAAGGGTVVRASEYGGYGNAVEIDHGMVDGHRVVTLYGHLSAFSVRVGSVVRPGETVGLVGSTGWSTACHLHFSVYVDNTPVDPLSRT